MLADRDPADRRLVRGREALVLAVTALMLILGVLGAWQGHRARAELAVALECQSHVNKELRDRIKATEPAGTAQLRAQLELLTTPPGDPERGRAALARYVQGLRDSLDARAANPIPTRDC